MSEVKDSAYADEAAELSINLQTYPAPLIVFGIPLKSKKNSRDWDAVQNNLRRTLRTLFWQRDANFHVIVCGHDKPDFGKFEDKVSWLPVHWDPPTAKEQYSQDKSRKRKWILVNLNRLLEANEGLYYFLLDADDLLSKDVVEFIRSNDNRTGYLVDKGYVFDNSNGNLAKMNKDSRPFYKSCGSSAVFWLDKKDLPKKLSDKTTFWSALIDHKEYPEVCEAHGRPLRTFPFYAAMYMLNHGNNNTEEKNNNVIQQRHASDFKIDSGSDVERILRRFGIKR